MQTAVHNQLVNLKCYIDITINAKRLQEKIQI